MLTASVGGRRASAGGRCVIALGVTLDVAELLALAARLCSASWLAAGVCTRRLGHCAWCRSWRRVAAGDGWGAQLGVGVDSRCLPAWARRRCSLPVVASVRGSRWRGDGARNWLCCRTAAGVVRRWPPFVAGVALGVGVGGGLLEAIVCGCRSPPVLAADGFWCWRGVPLAAFFAIGRLPALMAAAGCFAGGLRSPQASAARCCWWRLGSGAFHQLWRLAADGVGAGVVLGVADGGWRLLSGVWEALAAGAGDGRLLALAASWRLSCPFAVGSCCS